MDLAVLALRCVTREFPYNPAHVIRDPGDVKPPRALHPAFYGCFDWHSAVHGHWLLVHALRNGSALEPEIRAALAGNLTPENLRVEAQYLRAHPGFERPYGWAWLLKLAQELAESNEEAWLAALQPALDVVESLYLDWLPKQLYPIRSGTHTNTAFGLSFALDYSRAFRRPALEELLVERSKEFFEADQNYPAEWEPGGNDFFSPCLMEADLMRRVLADFPAWLARFLPQVPPSLAEPAKVLDRADGQLVHLDGLNLSRAWCFSNLRMSGLAEKHLRAGMRELESGHYEGEHWLATFAAYAAACAFDAASRTPASRSTAA